MYSTLPLVDYIDEIREEYFHLPSLHPTLLSKVLNLEARREKLKKWVGALVTSVVDAPEKKQTKSNWTRDSKWGYLTYKFMLNNRTATSAPRYFVIIWSSTENGFIFSLLMVNIILDITIFLVLCNTQQQQYSHIFVKYFFFFGMASETWV